MYVVPIRKHFKQLLRLHEYGKQLCRSANQWKSKKGSDMQKNSYGAIQKFPDPNEDLHDIPLSALSVENLQSGFEKLYLDLASQKQKVVYKSIENKYYRNQYKITKGTGYSRGKDDYFKKVKDNPDFHHPHHYSLKKYEIMCEANKSDPAFIINEYETYKMKSKYANPLNPLSLAIDENNSRKNVQHKKKTVPKQYDFDQEDEPIENTSRTGETDFGINCSKHDKLNLLTFAMKEEMRNLHASDPVNWTAEALASVFPVNPIAAKKIMKSNWKPNDEESLAFHDKRVLQNWQKVSNGKISSHKLIEEVIKRRKEGKLQSFTAGNSIPTVHPSDEDHEEIMSKLHFEDMFDNGPTAATSKLKKENCTRPRGGYWIDILDGNNKKNSYVGENSNEVELVSDGTSVDKNFKMLSTLDSQQDKRNDALISKRFIPNISGRHRGKKAIMSRRPVTYDEYNKYKH